MKLADYAKRHFEKHKRPLRIAVDEACWRFTTFSDEKVAAIREKEAVSRALSYIASL